jgi:hypothetical protein
MSTLINPIEVAARLKVATVSLGRWQATRQNKKETRAVNEAHNTDAAKVLVRVSDHPALRDLNRLHQEVYAEHRRLTVPSAQDGMRLLPAGREFEHAEAMRKFGDRHNKLVSAFLVDYPAERRSARARLNGLFDPSMFPSENEMPGKFKFETRYLPCPTDGAWSEWVEVSAREAEAEVRKRLSDALKRVRDNCKGDGKMYASMFEAIRDLTNLVPDLDISGQFAPVVKAMEPLAVIHAEDIKGDENKTARRKVSKQADNILSVLGGIK